MIISTINFIWAMVFIIHGLFLHQQHMILPATILLCSIPIADGLDRYLRILEEKGENK